MRETIKVSLDEAEYAALVRLADSEVRPIPMQARHIVIEALRERRMLPTPNETRQPAVTAVTNVTR